MNGTEELLEMAKMATFTTALPVRFIFHGPNHDEHVYPILCQSYVLVVIFISKHSKGFHDITHNTT